MSSVITKFFDYGQEDIDYLRSVDPVLGAAMARMGRVERVIIPDLFTALIYAIVGQLISVKAVRTIWNRMLAQFGDITPQQLALHTADEIQSCGMTMKKHYVSMRFPIWSLRVILSWRNCLGYQIKRLYKNL